MTRAAEAGRYVHSSGETVLRSRVDELQSLLVVVVLEHVDCENGTEDLLGHGDGAGVRGQDYCRLDIVSLGIVAAAANQDFTASLLGLVNVADDLVICGSSTMNSKSEKVDETEKTYITGPIKLVKSCGGPTLSLATSE